MVRELNQPVIREVTDDYLICLVHSSKQIWSPVAEKEREEIEETREGRWCSPLLPRRIGHHWTPPPDLQHVQLSLAGHGAKLRGTFSCTAVTEYIAGPCVGLPASHDTPLSAHLRTSGYSPMSSPPPLGPDKKWDVALAAATIWGRVLEGSSMSSNMTCLRLGFGGIRVELGCKPLQWYVLPG